MSNNFEIFWLTIISFILVITAVLEIIRMSKKVKVEPTEKNCPECDEIIKYKAKKCKHCGERIKPKK